MSIQKIAPIIEPIWSRKPATEKLVAGLLMGLAAIAAGNSGVRTMGW